MRCTRCGHVGGEKDNFCSDCGAFLRDAFIDEKLLFALQQQTEGNDKEARRALERLWCAGCFSYGNGICHAVDGNALEDVAYGACFQ